MMMRQTVTVMTPRGTLSVSWSAPPRIYLEGGPDDHGIPDPLWVQEPPFATLNGVEIDLGQAKVLLEETRDSA